MKSHEFFISATIRDVFAMAALPKMDWQEFEHLTSEKQWDGQIISNAVKFAYEVADKMMEQRDL